MSQQIRSWCRQCEGFCGAVATVDDGRLDGIEGDGQHPLSQGFLCDGGRATVGLLRGPDRITEPLKREGDRLVPIPWDQAVREIGERLSGIRRAAGPGAIALHAGGHVLASGRDAIRTAAFALGTGTTNFFTPQASYVGPFLYATERVVGRAVALQSDVGRAHFTVLMGGDRLVGQWGPLQAGSVNAAGLRNARKLLKAKTVVVDPRRTELAEMAEDHVPIRPGTETFYLLGLLHAVLAGDWVDRQYLRDYCNGFEEVREAVAPWDADRVAAICGVDRSRISGVALKFARAAMATVHRDRAMMSTSTATVGSWALLVLHAVTANLLRPGGLYEHPGLLDVEPLLGAFPTAQAPRSRVSGIPSLLLQLPDTALAEEVLTPGDGQVKALLALRADPLSTLPGRDRVERALGGLDLLVAVDVVHTATTRRADYVLPATHFWEQSDAHLLDGSILPYRFTQATAPVARPPAGARPVEAILADLFRAMRPPLRGGAFGAHLQLAGRWLATADLEAWEERAWDLLAEVPMEEVRRSEGGVLLGDIDRTAWRVTTGSGRLEMAPDDILEAARALEAPHFDPDDLLLVTRATAGRAPAEHADVEVHPATAERLGLQAGAIVRLEGEAGEMPARVVLDERLRPDTVAVPGAWGVGPDPRPLAPQLGRVTDGAPRDPFTGAAGTTGARVRLRGTG